MKPEETINKLRDFAMSQVDKIAESNPLVRFARPLVVRVIDNNLDKASKAISMLADKEGNIDAKSIANEMIDSAMQSKSFSIHTSFIGDINIGDGRIILNMPFTDKNIVFSASDLEELKTILSEE